jgi:hypothetical protein
VSYHDLPSCPSPGPALRRLDRLAGSGFFGVIRRTAGPRTVLFLPRSSGRAGRDLTLWAALVRRSAPDSTLLRAGLSAPVAREAGVAFETDGAVEGARRLR